MNTVYLLDVNVLIALADPTHVQHEPAHAWFAREGSRAFATCPITENGFVRIVGHARYPNTPGTPAAAAAALATFRALTGHHFWPDDISLLGSPAVDLGKLLSHGQVTDTYLLALARTHGGRLASLDRRLVVNTVLDGADSLALI